MWNQILATMNVVSAENVPSVSNLAVASTASGTCNTSSHTILTNAAYAATWTITNANTTSYQTLVYANGILVATLANSVTSYSKIMTGVLNDTGHGFTENVNYQVKVQRTNDSVIVGTSAVVNYTADYGDCSGIA